MPSRRNQCLPLTALALTALAVTSMLAGCAGGASAPPTDSPSQVTTEPTASAPASTPTTPAVTTPSTSSSAPSTAPPVSSTPPTVTSTPRPRTSAARTRAAQIPAKRLPGFNSEWVWDQAETVRGPGRQPPPVCSRSNLISIGGVVATRTDYGSSLSDQSRAISVTAVFPDVQTALTAQSVLTAWHDGCQRHLTRQGYRNPSVSTISDVATEADAARQWLVTYRPVPGEPDSAWFHAEGFVRRGDAITFLVVRTAGQDYNYEKGDQPIDNALKRAAAYLR